MQKQTPRRRVASPEVVQKRTLRLSKEHLRTLTPDDLSLVASGCPTGSWPSGTTQAGETVC